jgi:hypothetical protein
MTSTIMVKRLMRSPVKPELTRRLAAWAAIVVVATP